MPCLDADLVNPLVRMVCGTLKSLEDLGKPCSADDISQGRFVHVAFAQNASFCDAGPALKANGLATSVACCNDKNLCNALPVVPSLNTPPPSGLRCYQGMDSKIALQPVTSSRCAARLGQPTCFASRSACPAKIVRAERACVTALLSLRPSVAASQSSLAGAL